MNNLKRALSIGLTGSMLAGMMTISAGAVDAKDFTDADEISHTEAVTTMVALGVINGKDTGAFDPDGTVTRAEMAKMITIMMNGGKDPTLSTSGKAMFTDVEGHWAQKYIEYCAANGIIAGQGDGTFNPDGTVTGSQAAKMALVALGYDSNVFSFTGVDWEVAVNSTANDPDADLYERLGSLDPSQGLSRDDAAQLLFNALNAKMMEQTYDSVASSGEVTYKYALDDETMLEKKFNAVKVEGIVMANEVATLTSNSGATLDDERTRISVTNYEKDNPADDEQDEFSGTLTLVATTGMDELGRKVCAYVKRDTKQGKAEILGSVILSDDNVVVTDYSGDTIADVADDNNLDIVAATQVAFNYQGLTDYEEKMTGDGVRGVEKILIDTDDDGDLDYVLLNTYVFGKVTGKSTADDGTMTVNYSEGSIYKDDRDDVIGFDDVARNDYVNAIEIGDKLYVVKAESVTGELESYKFNSSKKITKMTVDGTDYDTSYVPSYYSTSDDITPIGRESYFNDIEKELDNEATFYLDISGRIVAVTASEESAYDYAYVWGNEASTRIKDARVKVTLSDGSKATYDLDDDSDASILSDAREEDQLGGKVYAYKLTDAGIKLTNPAENTANETGDSAAAVTFEKGKTGVTGLKTSVGTGANATTVTKYSNKNTVFFYVTLEKAATGTEKSVIDDVDVYIGYNAAPDVDATDNATAYAAYNKSGKMTAVAFESTQFTSSGVDDHIFVYDKGTITSDYAQAWAYLAGSDEPTEIKISSFPGNGITDIYDVMDGAIFKYDIDSDGWYELKEINNTNLIEVNAVLTDVSGNSVVLNGTEYAVTADTVLIDNTGDPDTPTATLGGVPEEDYDYVTYALVDDDEVLMIIVDNDKKTATDDTTGSNTASVGSFTAPAAAAMKVTTNGATTTLTMTGKDVDATVGEDKREEMSTLFGADVVTKETGVVKDDYGILTIDVLDLVERGSSYKIQQENEALSLFTNDEDIKNNVKTKEYTHSALRDGYALLIKEGSTVELTITSFDANEGILETVYVTIDASGLTYKATTTDATTK